jgi:ABC-type transport system substrate-binding protein
VNPLADLNNTSAEIYSTLFSETPGHLESSAYELEGGLAASFEVSPDGLTLTAKLRPNAKWHNIAPVNGRAVDAEDVLFSFQYHSEAASLRDLIWNKVSGGGFALEPSAPDAQTIVIPLSEPVAYAANWFAAFGSYTGQVIMFPKEASDPAVLDLRSQMIGTGPFYLKSHEPSVNFVLGRNEDYWDPDFALVDEIFMAILPEYASRSPQLIAGELHFGRPGPDIVRATDILNIKKDQEKLLMYETDLSPSTSVMTYGWMGENPFKDERVRQAISMSFDRDLDIDVRFNTEEFAAAGIPVRTAWNSHLSNYDAWVKAGWWLDPQGTELGEGAKYFAYNPDEAKKLLAAAGYPNGFDVKFNYPNAQQFDRGNIVEPYFFYLQEIGLNVIDGGQTDYTGDYIPNNRDARGEFDGLAYHSVTGSIPVVVDPTSALVATHLPSSGVTFHGYSVGGGGARTGDPALIEILEKAKIERDTDVRRSLLHEAQRYLAVKQWSLSEPGGATGYYLAWPAVQNYRTWQSTNQQWEKYRVWLDKTKAPFV